MRKRPLCTAAVAVLILLAAVNIWFESAISNPCTLRRIIPDASQVTVTGQVKRWEEKPDYRIFYLRDCQVLQKENNTNSDRQSVNKQFKEQVKAKVLARAGASNLYRTGSKRKLKQSNLEIKYRFRGNFRILLKRREIPGILIRNFIMKNRDFTQVYGQKTAGLQIRKRGNSGNGWQN